MYSGMQVYRAVVTASSSTTGSLYVSIPSVLGTTTSIAVSTIGRAAVSGVWTVPDVGDQVVVAVEDDKFSNVFLLYPVETSIAPGSITSTEIATNTIVDADISTSANISLSKLAIGALPTGITVTTNNITNLSITKDDISTNAGIELSKLQNVSPSYVLLGNSASVPTATAVTGDVTINSSGATAITNNAISNIKIADNAVTNRNILFDRALLDLPLNSYNQAIAAGASANVTFTVETTDTLGVIPSVPVSTITIAEGLYFANYVTWWDIGGSAKTTSLILNDAILSSATPSSNSGDGYPFYYATGGLAFYTFGGVIRLRVTNNTTGTRTVNLANFKIIKIA